MFTLMNMLYFWYHDVEHKSFWSDRPPGAAQNRLIMSTKPDTVLLATELPNAQTKWSSEYIMSNSWLLIWFEKLTGLFKKKKGIWHQHKFEMFSVWHESSFVLNNKLGAKDPSPFTAVKSTTLPKEPNPKSFRETNIRGSRHLLPCRLNLLYNSGWTQLFFFLDERYKPKPLLHERECVSWLRGDRQRSWQDLCFGYGSATGSATIMLQISQSIDMQLTQAGHYRLAL